MALMTVFHFRLFGLLLVACVNCSIAVLDNAALDYVRHGM